MKKYLPTAVLLLGLLSWLEAAPADEEVIDLPGLPYPPSFRQYSGYLNATNGNHLHYWLVEAETVDPATAPTVFWFNGGPGCSSIDGFLTENGPFHVNPDGQTLYYNPYSWNQIANVIFLESPAGVGFSYSDDGTYRTDDDQTAIDNYAALQSFYDKFPEYLANPLFITGESYAGVYIPTLCYLIVNGTNDFNFQGFAIGNGLHNDEMNFNSEILFDNYHGLNDQNLMTKMLTYCCEPTTPVQCDFYNPPNIECINAVLEASLASSLSGVNPYGIYDYCDTSVPSRYRNRRRRWPKTWPKETLDKLQNLRSDPPCDNSWAERQWINQPDVKAALHISELAVFPWETCSDHILYREIYSDMTSQYDYLLPRTRALLYHGDIDTVCNFLGGDWFVESLGREVLKPYRPWTYGNQTAGFVKDFANITFLTVLGSGHMVPTDKPAQALQMINNFINNQPYD